MDSQIKEWIILARKISKYLLHQREPSNHQDVENWGKQGNKQQQLLDELNQKHYFAQKAAKRKEVEEKYTWDDFVATQRKKARRRKIQFMRYAASIILILAAGSGILVYYFPKPEMPVVTVAPILIPGSMKASLVLGDGKEISLNDQLTITEKDGTIIRNNESGELAYQKRTEQDTTLQYNTLRVPRGGEYRLTLADGTKVWINSESELSYPTQFSANKREVYLKGEAYFEIAPNKQQPFFVNSNRILVRATGTAFNVMAYQDEPELQVTLVEGGVNIEENLKVISKLTPNHQFSLNKANGQFSVISVDPRSATVWKNGRFYFDNEMLASIIRKLSRWYNVEIQCVDPEITQYKFSGEIRKYEDASQVLNMLKLTNEITYTIQPDKKIIIYSTE